MQLPDSILRQLRGVCDMPPPTALPPLAPDCVYESYASVVSVEPVVKAVGGVNKPKLLKVGRWVCWRDSDLH